MLENFEYQRNYPAELSLAPLLLKSICLSQIYCFHHLCLSNKIIFTFHFDLRQEHMSLSEELENQARQRANQDNEMIKIEIELDLRT